MYRQGSVKRRQNEWHGTAVRGRVPRRNGRVVVRGQGTGQAMRSAEEEVNWRNRNPKENGVGQWRNGRGCGKWRAATSGVWSQLGWCVCRCGGRSLQCAVQGGVG